MSVETVSVVVPTYNAGVGLENALRSIASQTHPRERIEAIVIDDGSTDDSRARIRAFARSAPFEVKYAFQRNAGPAAARNHGLRLARGDAIAFLDADDVWQPTKLERQVALLSGDAGLVYCDAAFVDEEGRPLGDYVRTLRMCRGDILLPLFCDFFLLTSSVVLTRAAVTATGGFDETLPVGEDYEFFLRVAMHFKADHVAEKLLVRSVRAGSLSRRDYALDARIDLATLSAFLRTNPGFARRHRREVRRRLARYRYDFGYRLLADNRRGEAVSELLGSLRAQASVAAARTLVRAMLPRAPSFSGGS
jgi:glycosyltransferase involved in cell wall biosynthesis